MLNIVELLSLRGLDTDSKIKLVRHQDKRYDIQELRRQGLLELYQSYQAKPVFECDYVVSFIGQESSKACFFGVYSVRGRKPASEVPLPDDFIYPDFAPLDGYFYELEQVPGFEDLRDRVVINWGKSPLAWHQWLKEKEVIEVLPAGYVREFPGYLDVVLRYDELVAIIENPEANREWHTMLSAVAGIYLITDTHTGKQYVGSAYGEKGILGRWTAYAKSPHGGNAQLKELLASDDDYARHFQYSILDTLAKTLTKNEVFAREALYKRKLGTRAFGLNSN